MLKPGEVIGELTVKRRLGQGAMGAVYIADYRGRDIALKVLTTLEEESRERFRREALAQAAVCSHPNILTIHEVVDVHGHPALVCDLIEGLSLDERLARDGRFSWKKALAVTREVALALDHAHRRGILHRDLKGANILLRDDDDRPIIADFGLARDQRFSTLTHSQDVVGTPYAMAPEQLSGDRERLGPQTDIWALGVVLYELITGSQPFNGRNSAELASDILLNDPKALRELVPGLPRGVEVVVRHALEKDPADRPRSAAAWAEDIDRVLRGEAPSASQSRLLGAPAAARRGVALALAIGLILGLGGATLWGIREQDRQRRARAQREQQLERAVDMGRELALQAVAARSLALLCGMPAPPPEAEARRRFEALAAYTTAWEAPEPASVDSLRGWLAVARGSKEAATFGEAERLRGFESAIRDGAAPQSIIGPLPQDAGWALLRALDEVARALGDERYDDAAEAALELPELAPQLSRRVLDLRDEVAARRVLQLVTTEDDDVRREVARGRELAAQAWSSPGFLRAWKRALDARLAAEPPRLLGLDRLWQLRRFAPAAPMPTLDAARWSAIARARQASGEDIRATVAWAWAKQLDPSVAIPEGYEIPAQVMSIADYSPGEQTLGALQAGLPLIPTREGRRHLANTRTLEGLRAACRSDPLLLFLDALTPLSDTDKSDKTQRLERSRERLATIERLLEAPDGLLPVLQSELWRERVVAEREVLLREGDAAGLAKRRAQWVKWLERALELGSAREYLVSYELAQIANREGDREEALRLLDLASAQARAVLLLRPRELVAANLGRPPLSPRYLSAGAVVDEVFESHGTLLTYFRRKPEAEAAYRLSIRAHPTITAIVPLVRLLLERGAVDEVLELLKVTKFDLAPNDRRDLLPAIEASVPELDAEVLERMREVLRQT